MFSRNFVLAFALAVASQVVADHQFTFKNNCGSNVSPKIANVNCGYSPRCSTPGSGGVPNPAISYTGPQPNTLGPGKSQTLTINRQWNGRIFNQNGHCGASGENCSMGEFNLDTGNQFTAQAYDISNIQGFTQSMQIAVNGCNTVTCTNVNCGCANAYPPGDLSGCGNDSPVRGCSAGDHQWTVTFCP
ncbi:Pathogenesis-related protein 1A/1B [Psilocybe cubensis]|uniref:Thaumatin-like protein n=2 Tax=Psilocybe cubensis TaxID=181762 RepID=A0A8H8CME0_PSICU|nr:Pathogenesis-related protein 1A/1B [Psilocybe cubensis]KAH9481713.1 Pathogenesis-related protein 1A/1B [Psilocybe cubensis]